MAQTKVAWNSADPLVKNDVDATYSTQPATLRIWAFRVLAVFCFARAFRAFHSD